MRNINMYNIYIFIFVNMYICKYVNMYNIQNRFVKTSFFNMPHLLDMTYFHDSDFLYNYYILILKNIILQIFLKKNFKEFIIR